MSKIASVERKGHWLTIRSDDGRVTSYAVMHPNKEVARIAGRHLAALMAFNQIFGIFDWQDIVGLQFVEITT